MVEAAGSEDHSFQRPRLTLAVGAVVPTTLVSPEAVAVDAVRVTSAVHISVSVVGVVVGVVGAAAGVAAVGVAVPGRVGGVRHRAAGASPLCRRAGSHPGRAPRRPHAGCGQPPTRTHTAAAATGRDSHRRDTGRDTARCPLRPRQGRTLGVMALGWATPADRGGGAREPRSPRDRTAPPHGTQSGFFLHRVQLDATADRLRSPSTGVIRDEPRDTLEAAGPRIDDRTPQEASVSSTSTGLVLVSQVRVKGRPATDYRVPLASTPRRTGP
ncbi:hypothetical protein HPB47_001361 [Ixodes persulcatus]|uniref:Uncharacterized protein n=1 Tax=Ixodes persulcatus TaxID=34615 RepID=A0AC60PR36_IXOPE|nr:hypothetical protein HPB47_001361 [Ixodes persulcatus]